MSDHKQIKPKEKKGVNPLTAAVTGAIVGAGVVAAGIVALRNDKNRDKAKELVSKVKDGTKKYIKEVEEKIDHTKTEADAVVASVNDSNKEVKKIWQK